MSFSFEFTAKAEDAKTIVQQEYAPECVKEFLQQGLKAFGADALVKVKAQGHLFNNDHKISNGTLLVEEVVVRAPKAG